MANTLQVSETDGKDIFGAKSPVLVCQVKYAYAYLNHKEINVPKHGFYLLRTKIIAHS